jgi:hypothetical protein
MSHDFSQVISSNSSSLLRIIFGCLDLAFNYIYLNFYSISKYLEVY